MEEEALAQAPSHPRSSSSHSSSEHQCAKPGTSKESTESTAGPGRFLPQVVPKKLLSPGGSSKSRSPALASYPGLHNPQPLSLPSP